MYLEKVKSYFPITVFIVDDFPDNSEDLLPNNFHRGPDPAASALRRDDCHLSIVMR